MDQIEKIKLANALVDLHQSPGWQAFLKLLDMEKEMLDIQLVNSQTDNQLRFMQGQIAHHRQVRTMIPDFVANIKKKMEKQNDI